MSLTIRRAALGDEAVLAAFNAALAWETEHKRLRPDVLLAGVRAVLSDTSRGFYLVAEEAGEVLGQMMVTFEWSDWRNGWFWWVQSVYVPEKARRKGVFRSLYEETRKQACADAQVIGLRLYVEHDNSRAQETYRALGMTDTTYGLMEEYPLPGRQSDIG
jgi:ribosomal protein S18 acetylase RimI-like enzyme